MARMAGKIRIGISGWRYKPWRGDFYPEDLPQREELAYAAAQFPSIELNGSFYALQRPDSYRQWRDVTPRDFVFAIKGPRFITHVKRLQDVRVPLANFFASGLLTLGDKLGPVLWQLPPSLKYQHDTMQAFLEMLPHDTEGAARLARQHDDHLKDRAVLRIDRNRRLRHVVEVRHDSFCQAEFPAQLRRHGVALVVADTAGKWPFMEDVTAGFMYLRLHGDRELYASGYDDEALDHWAQRIRSWANGAQPGDAQTLTDARGPARKSRDVYVYFDNDLKVKAPRDARALIDRLS